MKLKTLITIALLLPGIAMAQYMGHSQYDPVMGGYRYYSAPNSGMENAAATQNFLSGMRMIQQSRQFNQMLQHEQELADKEMELRKREYDLQREERRLRSLIQ